MGGLSQRKNTDVQSQFFSLYQNSQSARNAQQKSVKQRYTQPAATKKTGLFSGLSSSKSGGLFSGLTSKPKARTTTRTSTKAPKLPAYKTRASSRARSYASPLRMR